MVSDRFTRFTWLVLAVNLGVILWGALVRATGSGAGCGSHWPDCNGRVIPLAPTTETMIEFTHRLTSGIALLLVLALFVWAFRRFEKGSPVRKGATASLVFIVIEALVGAGLVLFELVAGNDSAARAVVIALHLANTLLLVGALTLTAWWSAGGGVPRLRRDGPTAALLAGLVVVLILSMTGAVTALGDTLFPKESLGEGLRADVAPGAHFLVQLRVLHPVLAIGGGAFLLAMVHWVARWSPEGARFAGPLRALVLLNLGVGALNLALLAPIWMQLLHLLVADLLWIALVVFAADALAPETESAVAAPAAATP